MLVQGSTTFSTIENNVNNFQNAIFSEIKVRKINLFFKLLSNQFFCWHDPGQIFYPQSIPTLFRDQDHAAG